MKTEYTISKERHDEICKLELEAIKERDSLRNDHMNEQKYGVWITPKDKGKWLLDHTKSLQPWSGSLKEAESYASEKGSLFPEFVYEVVPLDFTVERPPPTKTTEK